MEIRELEEKLKAAYLNKARAAQIAEKEAMRLQQLVRKQVGFKGVYI